MKIMHIKLVVFGELREFTSRKPHDFNKTLNKFVVHIFDIEKVLYLKSYNVHPDVLF